MNIIDFSKSLLENIYFASGPLLVILGLFIFRQIKLAKNQLIISEKQLEESRSQMKINSQREAATLSADLLKEYISEIIPLQNDLYDLKKEIKYTDANIQIKNFTNDELLNWDKKALEKYLARPDNIVIAELGIVNRLEAFSVYFIKGIADEKVAFASIGDNFCKVIEIYYPTITLLRGNNNPNKSYENLVELFKCWKQRLNNAMIDFEKEKLSKDLKEKIERLENLKNNRQTFDHIRPIGT